jgi:hypothetical protein
MGRRVRRPYDDGYVRRKALKARSAVKWPNTGRRGVVAGQQVTAARHASDQSTQQESAA